MRNLWRKSFRGSGIALTAALGLGLASPGEGQMSGYLDFDGMTDELRSIVDGSNLARMVSVATSIEGREVWMVELGNPNGTPLAERPALMVVANLSGDHLIGSHLAVEGIRQILARAASDAEVQALLEANTIYVFPRANPDGAEALLSSLRWDRRGNARPYDDDNDGRIDEDAPNDLNGDGMITVMRVMDPEGDYIVHPDNDRLMKEADATEGEAGRYSIYWEGTDDDGDGFYNEDGPGGVDIDRNFQHEHPYYEADAGPHMVSEAESRALVDFAVANRNVAAVLTFGHHDNLVTAPNGQGRLAGVSMPALQEFANASNAGVYGVGIYSSTPENIQGRMSLRGAQPGNDNNPQSGRRPQVTVDTQDIPYFSAVSDAYKEITGIESVGMNRTAEGAFFQYGYYQYGVPSFSTQGWQMPQGEEEGRPARGASVEEMALHGMGDGVFVEWETVSHPDFGEVEVGGFAPGTFANPMGDAMDSEGGAKHGDFMIALAGMLPSISIVETEVTAHGGGIFTVEAVVENSGFFPTRLRHGVVSNAARAATVQSGGDPSDVLTGSPKTATVSVIEGSGNRTRHSWVIQGRNGASVEITARAQKGGTATTSVTLR